MDSKHICLAHYQQTAPGPEHSTGEAPASTHWNKLPVFFFLLFMPAYIANIVQVSWNVV